MNSSKYNSKILLLLFVGVLIGALDISIVGPALPAIEKSMQIHGSQLSWVFSIYILFYLFGIPMMSKLSDIHGRQLIYISSLIIFAAGSGLVFLSHNFTMLLFGRAIQGFGSSGIFPVAAATIGDVFPAEKRGRALGLLGAVFGIAFILGPLLAGSMLFYFKWNAIFLINIPIAGILIFFAAKLLPGKTKGKKPVINWPGIILLIVLLASYTLALNNIDVGNLGASIVSWSVLPFLGLVLILTPILIFIERTKEGSFFNADFLRSFQMRLVILIAFGLGMFQSSIVFLPKLAVELFHVSPSKASFMLLPLVLSTAIMPPVGGRLLDKIGSRKVIVSFLAFAVVSLILLSLVTNNFLIFYVAEVGLGIGLAIRASLKYIVLNEVVSSRRAASLGMLIIYISVGQLTGAALIGVILSGAKGENTGFGYAFLLLSAIAAIMLILSLFLKKKRHEMLVNQAE